MTIEYQVAREVTIGNQVLRQTEKVQSEGSQAIDVDVPDSATDKQVAVELDVSEIKALYMESDQDITVETNNGATPDDTINLKAGKPLIWTPDDPHPNPFASAVDVTDLFLSNSSGTDAKFKLRALSDVTP